MLDFINKVVTITMVFILMVIAPITISYMTTDMVSQREVLNEMTQFIDKVTDKAIITQTDLDDLYVSLNATGGTYTATVKRYIRLATQNDDGSTKVIYMADDTVDTLNIGDVVKVEVQEIGVSPAKRLLWLLLGIDRGQFETCLAGTVR